MTNTVSLRKGWVAKTAGLFIVTALAIAYFAFPALAAVNPQNLSAIKLQTVASKNVKVSFITAVDGRIPSNMTMPKASSATQLLGSLNLIDDTTSTIHNLKKGPAAVTDLRKGRWIGVTVTDLTSNQKYAWLCTLFNDPTISADGTSATIQCAMGQTGNKLMAPQALIKQVEGKLVNFKVNLDAQGKPVVSANDLQGSGWGALSVNVR